jgi:RND family efflux transporter MFP subunit
MKKFRSLSPFVHVVLVLAGALSILALFYITKPEPERRDTGNTATLAEVIRAQTRPTNLSVSGNGTAWPKVDLTLVSKVSGEVVYLAPNLHEGDFFRKGEPLIRIDPRPYGLAVESLQAQVRQGDIELERLQQEKKNSEADLELAEAEAKLAERDLERERELVRRGTHSNASRDKAETAWIASLKKVQTIKNQLALWPGNHAAAEARLQQLRAQLEDAKLNLEHTQIAAPFNGRVLSRLVEVGQFVNIGAKLAEVYDPMIMEIPLDIPMEEFQWIDTSALSGAGASRRAPPPNAPKAEARLTVGRNTYKWQGVVSRVDAQIDQTTRTVGLIIEINNQSYQPSTESAGALVPGVFLEVEIEGRLLDNIVVLPRGAIDQNNIVYLSNEDHLAVRKVSILRVADGLAYIDGGIESGELVVVSPLGAPVEGMPLKTVIQEDGEPGGEPKSESEGNVP